MARNYSIAEAVSIIRENKDAEAIADIGKRYPLLAIKIAVLVSKAPDEAEDLFGYVPSHVSANKINKAIKDAIEGTDDDTDDADDEVEEEQVEDEVQTPKKKAAPKKAPKKEADSDGGGKDFDSMTNKEMYNLLGELGERKACKEEFGDFSKKSMLSYLKAHHGEGMAESVDADDDWGEGEATNPYEGKSAQELFKLCKDRKIKAAPKKPAKFYIDLLMKADAEAETEDADDSWDDDEVEEEAPKKKATKKAPAKKAASKKSAKKAPEKEIDLDEDEDDDDEWDI